MTCSQDIVRFFEPVIQEIFRCIDAQLTERTKVCMMQRALGQAGVVLTHHRADRDHSRWLWPLGIPNKQTQREVFDRPSSPHHPRPIVRRPRRVRMQTPPYHMTDANRSDRYQPVSRGALLRYKDIQARGLPSKESFGIGRVETWDPEIHSDATLFAGVTLKNGRVCHKTRPNPRLVEEDPYDRKLAVVYERWEPLLKKVRQMSSVPDRAARLPLTVTLALPSLTRSRESTRCPARPLLLRRGISTASRSRKRRSASRSIGLRQT